MAPVAMLRQWAFSGPPRGGLCIYWLQVLG